MLHHAVTQAVGRVAAFDDALATNCRSASLKARDRIGWPAASVGATALNFRVFHIAATVAPLDTRMAGAPAVMPSNNSG